jgi:hypothetical protein
MTSRLDKLITVRRVASRMASSAFAESAGRALQQMSLVDRLNSASRALSPQSGIATGQMIGAQLELAGRMRAARQVARDRADAADAERSEAAVARKAAIRALDAAIDIRRAGDRARLQRREAMVMPCVIKDRI